MKKYILITLALVILMTFGYVLPAGPAYPPQRVDLESVSGNVDSFMEDRGSFVSGRADTAMLHVSADGDGSDGLSWTKAFTTIQDALDAASTDADDLTLILIGPGNYDINTEGDPTWSANVVLQGTHRKWGLIVNTHGSATSIMKLTGKAMISDLDFNLGTANNGVILTNDGARVYRSLFVGSSLTSAKTALHLDHASGGKYAKLIDLDFFGKDKTKMTAILIDEYGYSNCERIRIHESLIGVQIIGDASDQNIFNKLDIGDSALAIDIDAGNEQHYYDVIFHHNDANVDDEVGDSIWLNVFGALPIDIEPDNLVGVTVNTGSANTYGSDTVLRTAGTSPHKPFRIIGINMQPSTSNEWYQIRLSADSGSTHFDVIQFYGNKREGVAAPSGTEFIFNKGTRISASARDVSGGDSVQVWLEIQEI